MERRAQGNGQRVVLLDGDDLEGIVPCPWAEKQLHPEPLCALHRHPVLKPGLMLVQWKDIMRSH